TGSVPVTRMLPLPEAVCCDCESLSAHATSIIARLQTFCVTPSTRIETPSKCSLSGPFDRGRTIWLGLGKAADRQHKKEQQHNNQRHQILFNHRRLLLSPHFHSVVPDH